MTPNATAAVQRAVGQPPVMEPVQVGEPRATEIRVAIRAVGICHTDMVMRDGHLPVPQPVVLGHEGSGVVESVGRDVRGVAPGDHVVLSFSHCGTCPSCGDAQPAYCHQWFALNFGGQRLDGSTALTDQHGAVIHSHVFGQSSFATLAVVPAANAIKVDRGLPLELLGPLGCGIQTGAGAVLNALRVRPGSSVAVIGVGAVGLSAVMAAVIARAAIIAAVDLNPSRIELAQSLGATHGFAARGGAMTDFAAAAGSVAGFDYIIDTTGQTAVCNAALPALAPRGELALVGAYTPGQQIRWTARLP